MTLSRPARRRRLRRRIGIGALLAGLLVLLGLAAPALHLIDTQSLRLFDGGKRHPSVVAVYVSGDMGLRFLLGASTSRGLTEHHVPVVGISTPAVFRRRRTRAEVDAFMAGVVRTALARHGIPVVGVSSPVNFGTRKTRGEVDAVIANAIRTALARTGVARVVVMGQSYGADIVQTGLADLPIELRAKVAAIVLVLPGDSVYFRADPTGWSYGDSPDSVGVTTANTLTWAPLTCIYGVEEDDSLCPLLRVPDARVIGMPGGHNIHHDEAGLLRHVLTAVRAVAP